MLTMNTKDVLRRRAGQLGFDLAGIAPIKPGRDLEFAREWFAGGNGGEMGYLANPKRFDPREILPSVKSVICVGLVYDTPLPYSTQVESEPKLGARSQKSGAPGPVEGNAPPSNFELPVSNFQFPGPGAGRPRAWISRYAWGRDYHAIMREKLERLRAAIEELAPGTETRVYVDTGPVVERAFARFSGLGWMGKNTCIINEEKGSWFFLGVVLTNLELGPDLPAPDRCGTCRACLDACPTGALVEPYVMDASRCISYLTVELKGSIPRDLRPDVGVNVFGCDICQDVCPWNGKSRIQKSGVRSQQNGFEPIVVDASKLEDGNRDLESGNSKLEIRKSKVGKGRLLAKDEGQKTKDKNGKATVRSCQPDNRQSALGTRQSQPADTRHPAPETFSLFDPPLEALAAMTEEDFRRVFARSPIKRAKFRGWLRNLSVAMGNSGDERFMPKLKALAAHADPNVREHAEWAMNRITGQD
jgi:epoxyqueuosine reductase